MSATIQQDAALRAHLAEIRDDPTPGDRGAQERALDAAFRAVGYDPTWAEWRAYARRFLPAYRGDAAAP